VEVELAQSVRILQQRVRRPRVQPDPHAAGTSLQCALGQRGSAHGRPRVLAAPQGEQGQAVSTLQQAIQALEQRGKTYARYEPYVARHNWRQPRIRPVLGLGGRTGAGTGGSRVRGGFWRRLGGRGGIARTRRWRGGVRRGRNDPTRGDLASWCRSQPRQDKGTTHEVAPGTQLESQRE